MTQPKSVAIAASSGLMIKEHVDRIGALCFLQHNGQVYILGEHVDQADADETLRIWKLPQDRLDKASDHPGRDTRALLHSHFGMDHAEVGIWEVRMTALRDSVPAGHTERKGFRNTLTTWVAAQYYGKITTDLICHRPYKWILIQEFLDHCQEFKVPNYAEVLKLLDDLLNRPAAH